MVLEDNGVELQSQREAHADLMETNCVRNSRTVTTVDTL